MLLMFSVRGSEKRYGEDKSKNQKEGDAVFYLWQ